MHRAGMNQFLGLISHAATTSLPSYLGDTFEIVLATASKQSVSRLTNKATRLARTRSRGRYGLVQSWNWSKAMNDKPSPIEFQKYWNSKPELQPIKVLTAKRIVGLKAKCKEPEFVKNWKYIIDTAASLPFYQGQNDRKWKANVDWLLIRADNWVKFLERHPPTTPKPETVQPALTPRQQALLEMK
jgi:hypothetical protein